MFLKKLFSFSNKSDVLIFENSKYKMYSTTYEQKKASKIVHNEDVNSYNNVRKVRHVNILYPYKINLKNKSITTGSLLPFDSVYLSTTVEFNKYIFLCIAQALKFLHTNCFLQHNNLTVESLFFNEEGKIVIGGFEKSKIYKKSDFASFDSDNMQFSNLLREYTKINSSIDDFVQNKGYTDDFFYQNEIFFFGFESYSLNQKKEFICVVRKKKNEFVEIYKRRVALLFIQDLKSDVDKFYKQDIVDLIFYLDMEDLNECVVRMFEVLDTNVRMHLFKNEDKFVNKITNFDKIFKPIVLGLKCRNKLLRSETISFLQNNNTKLNETSQLEILEIMYNQILDTEGVREVLKYISFTKPLFKKNDIVYKMLKKYLIESKHRRETIETIQIFYPAFNKYKVSTELLPLLCACLAEEELQSKTFLVIEEILIDLKNHKENIISRDWSLDSIKGFFNSRTKNKINHKETTVKDVEKDEGDKEGTDSDGWDDEW